MDYDYLPTSNGSGDAAVLVISADRSIGASVIAVGGSTPNISGKFIGTYGTVGSDDKLVPSSKRDFKGHTSGGALVIDAFEPGSTDAGNTAGQVVVIKPNTGWANRVAKHIMNATGFGTPENLTAANLAVGGTLSVTGATTIGGNLSVTGSFRTKPRVSTTTSTASLTPTTDTANIYDLTAQAVGLTINAPTGTPNNGDPLIFRIKDNGTSQSITWNAAFVNISGLDTLTSTAVSKWHVVGALWNATVSKWQVISITTEA